MTKPPSKAVFVRSSSQGEWLLMVASPDCTCHIRRVLPKKATSVLLGPPVGTSDGVPMVLVADKIGDVRAYFASTALVRSVSRSG